MKIIYHRRLLIDTAGSRNTAQKYRSISGLNLIAQLHINLPNTPLSLAFNSGRWMAGTDAVEDAPRSVTGEETLNGDGCDATSTETLFFTY